MYPVLLLAAIAILGGVLVVAMGRGGEMALFSRDAATAVRYPRTPAEVATQRLPLGPVGYQVQATEEALISAANLLAERDQEIAELRSEISRLTGGAPEVRDPHAAYRPPPMSDYTASGDDDRPVDAPPPADVDEASEATEAGLAGTEQSWRQ